MESLGSPASGQSGNVARERLVPSAARVHASSLDDCAMELLASERDRTTVALPPLRELLGVLVWSLGPGVPLFALVGWQASVVAGGAGLLLRSVRLRAVRPGLQFADGFLKFRGDDVRARGVQEEDDVRWRWPGRAMTGGREDGTRPS
jgi:hypothetical protein